MKNNKKLFSVLFKISVFLLLLGILSLIICEPLSAEFYISIVVVAINAALAVTAAIFIRKNG